MFMTIIDSIYCVLLVFFGIVCIYSYYCFFSEFVEDFMMTWKGRKK